MNEDEVIETKNPSTNIPHVRSPYEMLVRQSKKMGNVATRAFRDVKDILHKEVQLPAWQRAAFTHAPAPVQNEVDAQKEKELRDVENLKHIVKKSHEVLASARTVFPVTLFPDSIIVDRTKVSIIKRDFFWTSNTISFQIEDVLNVSCGTGPLFGSLTIASRVMSTIDHFQINFLWRNDAIFFKHLIQGHIIAKNNKLETDKLSRKEMIETLCELGMDSDR
ncbi:MAG TPA: hypothetical protein VLG36_03795 [Candidatus Chromulinivoraceae bacterium]|nr:hypothetical protein [Candidatus Chromulinivoraceae bacterium]